MGKKNMPSEKEKYLSVLRDSVVRNLFQYEFDGEGRIAS